MKFLKSRMNRATYWSCIAVILAWALFSALVLEKKSGYVSEIILALLCVPRVHDIGKSAWVVVSVLVAYIISVLALLSVLDFDNAQIMLGVLNLVVTGLMIFLGALRGQDKANEYGDPPRSGIDFRMRRRQA